MYDNYDKHLFFNKDSGMPGYIDEILFLLLGETADPRHEMAPSRIILEMRCSWGSSLAVIFFVFPLTG